MIIDVSLFAFDSTLRVSQPRRRNLFDGVALKISLQLLGRFLRLPLQIDASTNLPFASSDKRSRMVHAIAAVFRRPFARIDAIGLFDLADRLDVARQTG